MKFGKIIDEPLAEYHGCDAISKTKLDVFRRNPDLFRRIFVAKDLPKPEASEPMLIGAAAGAFILEGQKAFDDRYVVLPKDAPDRPTTRQLTAAKPSPATVETIKWWEAFLALNVGRQVLTQEQWKLVTTLLAATRRNPQFVELTSRGQPEVTFRIRGEKFAVQVRPDWWNEEGCALTDGQPYVLDLKTIAELPQDDPEHLSKHIANYGYHRAAYLYSEIAAVASKWAPDRPRPRFFLGFVEKAEPFHCEVVELTDLDVEIGQREVTHSLLQLRRCMDTGVWMPKPVGIRRVSLPTYYVRRSLEVNEPNLAA